MYSLTVWGSEEQQPSKTPTDVVEEGNEQQPSIDGTWYLRMRTSTDARVPIIGTTNIKTTTHMLIKIDTREEGLFQSQKTCVVDTRPSRKIAQTTLPKAFIDHLPEKTYPITLKSNGRGGWDYRADLKQQYVGYRGALAKDGIPKKADHPAVYDWDEDGKPGASVLVTIPIIGNTRIYMVQTNHTFLNGALDEDGVIRGTAHQRILQQRTIGADNRLLAASPNVSISPGHDAFELMRRPSGTTCAEIETEAKTSF
jgi:hypothetical protein